MNYFSIFKIKNIDIEGPEFRLTNALRFVKTRDYHIDQARALELAHYNTKFPIRLHVHIEGLRNSELVIEEVTTENDHEHNPFDADSNSMFAIAISIMKSEYFCAGFNFYYNDHEGRGTESASGAFTLVKGTNGTLSLLQADKPELTLIYDFVCKGLKPSRQDDTIFRLIILYSRVIVLSDSSRSEILESNFGSIYNESNSSILNAAILCECIFTRESGDYTRGVDHWNNSFPNAQVNLEQIKAIMKFRHIEFHNNATKAIMDLEAYKIANNLADQLALVKHLDLLALSWSRSLMKTIALNYDDFLAFQATLPARV